MSPETAATARFTGTTGQGAGHGAGAGEGAGSDVAGVPPVPPGRVATPIGFAEGDLSVVRFAADGLVPAVVQDASDGAVLMLGYMDEEAVRRTLTSGRTWFWSRSRREYWCKGETSGDRQWVREVRYDCDGDALLVVVDQDGNGACHTGARSCFYRSFGADGVEAPVGDAPAGDAPAPG